MTICSHGIEKSFDKFTTNQHEQTAHQSAYLMVCIYCGCDTAVFNSRARRKNPSVWRRRRCNACVAQFTTIELPDYSSVLVVEGASGKLYPFSRDKLYLSIHRSVSHRQDAVVVATELTSTIISRLLSTRQAKDGLITMKSIAEAAHTTLGRFDGPAANTYFAYHQKHLQKMV